MTVLESMVDPLAAAPAACAPAGADPPPRLSPRLTRADSGAPTGGADSGSCGQVSSGERSVGEQPNSETRRRARPKQQRTRLITSKYVRRGDPPALHALPLTTHPCLASASAPT